MKKKLIIGSAVIIVIAIVIFVTYLRIFRKANTEAINKKPDLVMSADSLVASFNLGPDSAVNARFVDKVIQVKGTIAEINKDTSGYVILLRDSTASEGVSCSLGTDQLQKVQSLQSGKVVNIKGICSGKLIDVSLNKCAIIEQ